MTSVPITAECPRCGYDLRGEVSTWGVACPLDGVCAECGLALAWCEVLRPDHFEPRWSIEYATPRRFLLALGKTAIRSLVPWRFWAAMKMSHRIRPARLAWYVVVLLLLVLVSGVLEQASVAVGVRHGLASIRPVTAVNHTYGAAILEAVLTPWSSSSRGSYQTPFGTRPYPAPGELHYFLWQVTQSGQFIPASHESPVHEWLVPVGLGWAFTTAIYLVMPIGFVLLPVSRRRAKVRWAHVGRVTVYSLILPWLFVVVSGAGFTGGMFYAPSITIIVTTTVASVLLPLPLLVLWWTFAVGRYLRIPHGFVVASLLTIMWFLLLVLGIPLVMLAFE